MHRTSIPLHSYYYWFSIWYWLALKYQGLTSDENASDKFADTQRLHVRFRRNTNGNESSCSNHDNCTERVRQLFILVIALYYRDGITISIPLAKYLTTWRLLVLSLFAFVEVHQCWSPSCQISTVLSPHRPESNSNRLSYWFDYITITFRQAVKFL